MGVLTPASFDDLLKLSVYESLTKTLGEDTWKALTFYFDLNRIATHPEHFETILNKLFGTDRSQEIQKLVIECFLTKTGGPRVPIVEGKGLDDYYASPASHASPGFIDWIQRARTSFTAYRPEST